MNRNFTNPTVAAIAAVAVCADAADCAVVGGEGEGIMPSGGLG